MRYETPAPPAELGEVDGLAYSLWLPEGDPWAGVVILHGARLVQGEPPRLRPRGARGRALGGLLRPARARRHRRRARRPRARRRRHRRGAARRRPAGPARLEHGRLPRDPRRRSALGARAVVGDLPGERRRAVARPAQRRARVPRRRPLARGVPRRAPARRGGRAARRCRCCSCTPRATSACRSPTRASWRGARPTRARELVVVPGGHHRSVQHDAELQGHALRWLRGAISGLRGSG